MISSFFHKIDKFRQIFVLKIQTGQQNFLQTEVKDKITEDNDILPNILFSRNKNGSLFYTTYILNLILIDCFLKQRFAPKAWDGVSTECIYYFHITDMLICLIQTQGQYSTYHLEYVILFFNWLMLVFIQSQFRNKHSFAPGNT